MFGWEATHPYDRCLHTVFLSLFRPHSSLSLLPDPLGHTYKTLRLKAPCPLRPCNTLTDGSPSSTLNDSAHNRSKIWNMSFGARAKKHTLAINQGGRVLPL